MSSRRPDVTDEDIGMRTFQLRKAKAVERAFERLRHGLQSQWSSLTNREVEELEWIFGELWAYVARNEWESLAFGSLSMHDVRVILGYGRELRKHTRDAVEILNDVGAVVAKKG
jgi:hypothetical protein